MQQLDKGSHALAEWKPEDVGFWEETGKQVANRNLLVSVPALTLAFIVWQMWSVAAVHLNSIGFSFTQGQLFTLAALPGLVGATLRFFYTFANSIFGGRNWTIFSTSILLLPLLGIAYAVQNVNTPYWVFMILAALCGLGGGNFSSSNANIGAFYPKAKKGTALGINGGIGNLGVSLVQLITPLVITTSIFGFIGGNALVTETGEEIWLQNAALIWVVPTIILTVCAYLFMDNLPTARQSLREQASVFKDKHFWIQTLLYTAAFGSFIGYAAAFPMILKLKFPESDLMALAFLGAFLGASSRPFGGWISDKIGAAKVTVIVFGIMALGTISVIMAITNSNLTMFFISFVVLFIATGLNSGATFAMIPHVFVATKTPAVVGFSAAFAAYGAFFIPKMFGWSLELVGSFNGALFVMLGLYAISIAITIYYYLRSGAEKPIR